MSRVLSRPFIQVKGKEACGIGQLAHRGAWKRNRRKRDCLFTVGIFNGTTNSFRLSASLFHHQKKSEKEQWSDKAFSKIHELQIY